jgi:hypothetical protein
VKAAGNSTKTVKKGSFAEIMARAAAAQKSMGPIGKIQHKPLEKLPSKRERQERKAEQTRAMKKSAREAQVLSKNGVTGTARVRNGTNGAGISRNANGVTSTRRRVAETGKTSISNKKVVGEEEKKVKKAALATTGYTGTARPRPGASSSKSAPTTSRQGSISGSRDGPRYPSALSSRRSRGDDYDDEMDDFIDYDDEQPEELGYGYGKGGYSDEEEESDMEAGLTDIDEEERRAEYYARREDEEQEALEKKLKREKEERKRKLLGASGAKVGRH